MLFPPAPGRPERLPDPLRIYPPVESRAEESSPARPSPFSISARDQLEVIIADPGAYVLEVLTDEEWAALGTDSRPHEFVAVKPGCRARLWIKSAHALSTSRPAPHGDFGSG